MTTTNVVLMAGKGERFAKAGYAVSKPLLPVSGKPMVIRATECMPPADKWVFVARKEHAEDRALMAALRSVAADVSIVIDPNPIGQLNSCLVAKEFYDNEGVLFVGACDFAMIYDKTAYDRLVDPAAENRPDMIVWSFTEQPNLTQNPRAWGWLEQDANNIVRGVSVKVPVSDNPYHDFALTGSFTFRSGGEFLKMAEGLMRRNIRVKNEFYIDSIAEIAIAMGYRVVSFPVARYIGWGTPSDYKEYCYWEKAIRNPRAHPAAEEKPEHRFWYDYFKHTPPSQ